MKLFKEINYIVAVPVILICLGIIIFNAASPETFGTAVEAAAQVTCDNLAWLFGIITMILVVVMAILLFHPIGKIRLGSEEDAPKFSTFKWWAMIICSSIGIGVVFWGVAEPLYHYADPCAVWGYEAMSNDLVTIAIAQSNIHYAFGQYCYYAFFGVLIALAAYNFKQPMAPSSCFYFMGNKPVKSGMRNLIDMLCVFGTVAGVTYSLGVGIMQIGSGIGEVFKIAPSYIMWVCIIIGVVAIFTTSSRLGIAKGMAVLSDWNVKIYLGVLVFIFIVGPTVFILNMSMESLGVYIMEFIPRTLFTGGPDSDPWSVSWTTFMFASVVGVAPMIGLFYARISKGRTIREVVVGLWVVPSVFNIVWFSIFGGTGIYKQKMGEYDLWGAVQELGVESTIYQFFKSLPLGTPLIVVFLICIVISFVTFADSMTGCISLLCMRDISKLSNDEEAPATLKFVWGILIGFTSLAFITFGGIFTVRRVPLIAGFPLFALTAVLIYVFVKIFFTAENNKIKEMAAKIAKGIKGSDTVEVAAEEK